MGSTVDTSKMLLDLASTMSNLNSMIGRSRSKYTLIFFTNQVGQDLGKMKEIKFNNYTFFTYFYFCPIVCKIFNREL